MGITTEQLVFDPALAANGSKVGAYLYASGGALTSTTVGGDEALDVNIVQAAGQKAEDAASASGDTGNVMLAVRADSPPANAGVSADGDYTFLYVSNEGKLWTQTELNSDVADDAVSTENPILIGQFAKSGALNAVSAGGDKAYIISDLYRRQYVNTSPNVAWQVNTVAVDNVAAVQLDATLQAGRRYVIIQNLGSRPVYIGASNAVTVGTGFRIAAGGNWQAEVGPDLALWAIGTNVTADDVRVAQFA